MSKALEQAMAESAKKRRAKRLAENNPASKKQSAEALAKSFRTDKKDPLGNMRGKMHIAKA